MNPFRSSKRVLEPIDRVSEILFGLAMVVLGSVLVGITIALGG